MSRVKHILISITLTFSFLISTTSVEGQAYDIASYYYENGSYDAALKEFLRAYYLDQSPEEALVPLRIAELYAQKGDIKEAIKYYDIQYFALPSGSPSRNTIRFEKIKTYLLSKQYQKAKIEVLQINKSQLENLDKLIFYKGLIYYFNDEYARGLKELNKLSYLSRDQKIDLNTLARKLVKNSKRSTTFYQIASGILPGLGQYFAGDIKGGLNSTLLNAGLIYVFFSVAERLSYQDALLTVSPWVMRYFVGGVGNAKEAADSKKANVKSALMKESIEILQSSI